jgi:hypothetical protein
MQSRIFLFLILWSKILWYKINQIEFDFLVFRIFMFRVVTISQFVLLGFTMALCATLLFAIQTDQTFQTIRNRKKK